MSIRLRYSATARHRLTSVNRAVLPAPLGPTKRKAGRFAASLLRKVYECSSNGNVTASMKVKIMAGSDGDRVKTKKSCNRCSVDMAGDCTCVRSRLMYF